MSELSDLNGPVRRAEAHWRGFMARARIYAGLGDVRWFIDSWELLEDELAHEPSIEEFADRWEVATEQVRHDLHIYRDLFPGESTPSRLSWAIRDELGPLPPGTVRCAGCRAWFGVPPWLTDALGARLSELVRRSGTPPDPEAPSYVEAAEQLRSALVDVVPRRHSG
jgi:hypothetical protein